MIIGLSGYARSGKDTVADILVKNHGFRKVAFADKLREVLYALDPIVSYTGWRDYKGRPFAPSDDTYVTVQNVIDYFGWDGYKESQHGDEIRRLLQRLGTEAGRQVLGEDIWVDTIFNKSVAREDIVISDCRYKNEANAIEQRYDGDIWRIERPGVRPANSHISETDLDDWNFAYTINNSSTIAALETTVAHVINLTRSDYASGVDI